MTVQECIALIEALVWPLSLVTIVLLFRKNIANSFNRLGSITASATGLSLNFETALEQAKEIFQESEPIAATSKSHTLTQNTVANDPMDQVIAIKKSLRETLTELASENAVDVQNKNLEELAIALGQRQVIGQGNAQKIVALLRALETAPLSIKRHQVEDLQRLYNSI